MTDLSVTVSPSGLAGIDKEIREPVKAEAVSVVQANTENISSIRIAEENDKEKEAQATPSEVQETVQEVNAFLQSMQRNLSFTIDEQLGERVISVKDAETDEIIRQIPSEELVVLRKKMDDVVGILFDTKV